MTVNDGFFRACVVGGDNTRSIPEQTRINDDDDDFFLSPSGPGTYTWRFY